MAEDSDYIRVVIGDSCFDDRRMHAKQEGVRVGLLRHVCRLAVEDREGVLIRGVLVVHILDVVKTVGSEREQLRPSGDIARAHEVDHHACAAHDLLEVCIKRSPVLEEALQIAAGRVKHSRLVEVEDEVDMVDQKFLAEKILTLGSLGLPRSG